MKKHIAFRILTGLLLSLAIAGVVFSCGKKDAAGSKNMVVVFAVGDAKIIKGGVETPAAVGMVVNENDQIKTVDGSIDLQTKTGSAVRIRPFTTITVARLSAGESETRISMEHGGLLASVKKESSKESFNVVTPTAIAGVRGTTFSMEVDNGQKPVVRVLDGSVAMAPHIPALDSMTQEQINASPALQQLAAVQRQEVVLQEKTEGSLPPAVEERVIQANQVLAVAPATANAPAAAPSAAQLEQVSRIAQELKAAPVVDSHETEITAREQAEKDTLVTVSPETVQRVIDGSRRGDTAGVEDLKKEQESRQNQVLQRIQEQAQKVELKTEQEIREHYNSLETIIMKDGTKLSGAVIAQTGEQLVVHTPNGVVRIRKADVASQEF